VEQLFLRRLVLLVVVVVVCFQFSVFRKLWGKRGECLW
jgi:hypothetical protein